LATVTWHRGYQAAPTVANQESSGAGPAQSAASMPPTFRGGTTWAARSWPGSVPRADSEWSGLARRWWVEGPCGL